MMVQYDTNCSDSTVGAIEIGDDGKLKLNKPEKEWEVRLYDEFQEIEEKTGKLSEVFDKRDVTLSFPEWSMLKRQYLAMVSYYSVLYDRCLFYGFVGPGKRKYFAPIMEY